MSDFARELISSMEEALEHAKGGKTGVRVHSVEPVDVKKARKALKMTQPDFARLVGTSVSGLQKWEQGKRQPGGAARTLIEAREPLRAVGEVLHEQKTFIRFELVLAPLSRSGDRLDMMFLVCSFSMKGEIHSFP